MASEFPDGRSLSNEDYYGFIACSAGKSEALATDIYYNERGLMVTMEIRAEWNRIGQAVKEAVMDEVLKIITGKARTNGR